MTPTEQQYRPELAGAPSAAAEGLAAISADRSGVLHWLRTPVFHDCPDGAIGLTELVGGMLNLEARNREALERMEKK